MFYLCSQDIWIAKPWVNQKLYTHSAQCLTLAFFELVPCQGKQFVFGEEEAHELLGVLYAGPLKHFEVRMEAASNDVANREYTTA